MLHAGNESSQSHIAKSPVNSTVGSRASFLISQPVISIPFGNTPSVTRISLFDTDCIQSIWISTFLFTFVRSPDVSGIGRFESCEPSQINQSAVITFVVVAHLSVTDCSVSSSPIVSFFQYQSLNTSHCHSDGLVRDTSHICCKFLSFGQ